MFLLQPDSRNRNSYIVTICNFPSGNQTCRAGNSTIYFDDFPASIVDFPAPFLHFSGKKKHPVIRSLDPPSRNPHKPKIDSPQSSENPHCESHPGASPNSRVEAVEAWPIELIP